MPDELTPEMISCIISDPTTSIGAEIARRAAESGSRSFTCEEMLAELRRIDWDERWERMSPEERRRELRMMDDHVAEQERVSLDGREDSQ